MAGEYRESRSAQTRSIHVVSATFPAPADAGSPPPTPADHTCQSYLPRQTQTRPPPVIPAPADADTAPRQSYLPRQTQTRPTPVIPAPADADSVHSPVIPAPADADSAPRQSYLPPADADSALPPVIPAPADADSAHRSVIPAPADADSAHTSVIPAPADADSAHTSVIPAPADADSAHTSVIPAPADADSALTRQSYLPRQTQTRLTPQSYLPRQTQEWPSPSPSHLHYRRRSRTSTGLGPRARRPLTRAFPPARRRLSEPHRTPGSGVGLGRYRGVSPATAVWPVSSDCSACSPSRPARRPAPGRDAGHTARRPACRPAPDLARASCRLARPGRPSGVVRRRNSAKFGLAARRACLQHSTVPGGTVPTGPSGPAHRPRASTVGC